MIPEKHAAKLVRGNIYLMRSASGSADFEFHKGVAVVVDGNTAEYLSAIVDEVCGSVDPDDGSLEILTKSKFEIEDYDGEAAIGSVAFPTPPAPRRTRQKAA